MRATLQTHSLARRLARATLQTRQLCKPSVWTARAGHRRTRQLCEPSAWTACAGHPSNASVLQAVRVDGLRGPPFGRVSPASRPCGRLALATLHARQLTPLTTPPQSAETHSKAVGNVQAHPRCGQGSERHSRWRCLRLVPALPRCKFSWALAGSATSGKQRSPICNAIAMCTFA